jgi:hypothetical protein
VHDLARGWLERLLAGVAVRRLLGVGPPLRIHGLDGANEMLKVAQRRFPLPFAGGPVAEYHVVAVIAKVRPAVAEFVPDRLNVFR